MSLKDEEKTSANLKAARDGGADSINEGHTGSGGLHRRLNNRQIQLIAIGGSIGTALFISIGGGLAKGGPGSLLISFVLYSGVLALVNNSLAEMNTYMPLPGGFIRLAGYWVDDALGFLAGWNFFLYEALMVPFEITALNMVLSFWSDKMQDTGPTVAIIVGVVICYALLNFLAVGLYGEAEFWLSGGKLILIFLLFAFTFVTMVGGNPQKDAYGFRHWNDPFAELNRKGDLGRFEGFLGSLWTAAFTIVGPEYISMVSAEAKHPSIYVKNAFKTVYYRFMIFFVFSALCVGTVVAYNDPALYAVYFGDNSDAAGTAAASPYIIAMENLGVDVLPHIVNALILTSIFSAGNTLTYCATRSLYSLALEGRAPKVLRYCNKRGIPVYCFIITMVFPFLSFLQLGNGSSQAITWFVNITTGSGMITFIIISITFINYHKAAKVQGFDRRSLPYYGYFQPYGAYIALAVQSFIVLGYGYTSFDPWNVSNFFANYTMQLVAPCLFFGWKLLKKTRYIRPSEVDLIWDRPEIEAYERNTKDRPTAFWTEIGQLVGIKKDSEGERDWAK